MNNVRLGDVARIAISGVDKKTKDGEHPVRLCNYVDVYHNWSIHSDTANAFMEASVTDKELAGFSLRRGQVAITKDSETRDDIGHSTYIADDLDGVVLGYHCALITPDKTMLDGSFLNALLHTGYARKCFENNASGSGQRYTLTIDALKKLELQLPALEVQRPIGDLLDSIDKKIAVNRKIMDELERTLKLIFDYWFVQYDFPMSDGRPYKTCGSEMIWNEDLHCEIPAQWSIAKLDTLITLVRGVSYTSANLGDSGSPMINLASFSPDCSYNVEGIKYFNGQFQQEKTLHPYDLVICNTQQTALNPSIDIIGKPLLVPDIFDRPVMSSHHVTTVKAINEPIKYYLYSFFKTPWFATYIAGYATGTSILGLDNTGLLNLALPIPPDYLLDQFASLVLSAEREKSRIILENQSLLRLRDWLLPMLISGQAIIGE